MSELAAQPGDPDLLCRPRDGADAHGRAEEGLAQSVRAAGVVPLATGRGGTLARWRDLTGTRRPDKPWLDGLPRFIFGVDMGDGFTASVDPDDWPIPKLGVIAAGPHRWLLLTKRIDQLAEYADRHELPPNVWAGASVTSPQDARIRTLKQVRAAVRFVSLEPILTPVDVAGWFPGVDCVIVGGASGETPT